MVAPHFMHTVRYSCQHSGSAWVQPSLAQLLSVCSGVTLQRLRLPLRSKRVTQRCHARALLQAPMTSSSCAKELVAALALESDTSSDLDARQIAACWLAKVPLQPAEQECEAITYLDIAQRGITALQLKSEPAKTYREVLWLCLCLHKQSRLPVKHLIETSTQHQLALWITQSDDSELLVEPAGRLLRVLWQQQPSLMDDFVSDNHLEPLLERMVASRRLEHAMIMVKLVQDIWSSTTALQAESQLVEALPGLIQACKGLDEGQTRTAAGYPLTEHIKHIYLEHQEAAGLLLCNMAELPFYRPAIRQAEPVGAVIALIKAGCLEGDGEQQQYMAQLACNLVHKLLQGQTDGSDGPDAAFNTHFMSELSSSPDFVCSLLLMCKNGSFESRHEALAALQAFLAPTAWHEIAATMRWQLMTFGAVPTLFGVATDPSVAEDMQDMALTCLAHFDGDDTANSTIAACGSRSMLSKLIHLSLRERREGQASSSL